MENNIVNEIKNINKELYILNNNIYKRELENIDDKRKIEKLRDKLMRICDHEWSVDNSIKIDRLYICKKCNIETT